VPATWLAPDGDDVVLPIEMEMEMESFYQAVSQERNVTTSVSPTSGGPGTLFESLQPGERFQHLLEIVQKGPGRSMFQPQSRSNGANRHRTIEAGLDPL
jgi:hypothetical protein